ncbi:MAG TPA: cyclic nucleotide-binding domain-containing protein [Terriglobales bacterium]|nr:cyclic nucleotide-binding domain-containing protein [Terriglobales bacterium]
MATAALKAAQVFSYLKPEEIDHLSKYANTEHYKAGEIVYAKGQPASRAYVLLQGEVILRAPTAAGHGIVLGHVGPGTMIGASVLLGETYMVTAQCVTDCKIMTLAKSALEQIMSSNPQMGLVIEKYLATLYYQRSLDLMQMLEGLIRGVLIDELGREPAPIP